MEAEVKRGLEKNNPFIIIDSASSGFQFVQEMGEEFQL